MKHGYKQRNLQPKMMGPAIILPLHHFQDTKVRHTKKSKDSSLEELSNPPEKASKT
jgi:hypothetical protein